jgi:hypothetical protein
MGTNLYIEDKNEYFSELEKLIDARNKAREYFPPATPRPAEESPKLKLVGKKVFLRLKKNLMHILTNIGFG